MKRKLLTDDEGVSPVIAVILMVAITVVLAAVLYVWAASFLDQGDSAPFGQVDCTKNSNGDYQCKVIKISSKLDLEAFQYFLKDTTGVTAQFGEIALQNISGEWHGVDVTWDDDGSADTSPGNGKANRADSAGGAYSDPTQAQTRIDAVQAGSQTTGTYQKAEGTISVSFSDNDRDGKLSSGDQFTIQGNDTTHTADDDWVFEIQYDITGDVIGSKKLGA